MSILGAMTIFESIKNELDKVNTMLNKEYLIKAGHLSSFAHLEFTPLNSIIRPAMVILSSRLFNYIGTQVISLAAVVQFIYLASMIHSGVSDDHKENMSNIDPRDGSQFPVLVGDYLYGKFFTSLCNAQIVQYLEPLSLVICSIHEGGILRHKTTATLRDKTTWEEIAYKETGALFETGCKLAADLAGASDTDQNNIASYGRELGTAYGLLENKIAYQNIEPHLKRAQLFLNCLPHNEFKIILQEFLIQLQKNASVSIQENGR